MFAKKQNKKFADAIIMNDERVSVDSLRKKAKRANTKFWGMAVSMGMVSSLVLPYMSMAAVAPSNSNVFTGEVIPGYSMGGVTLAAYGVDINSWGEVSKDTVVGSNYGVWSGPRLASARSNVSNTSTLLSGDEAQNYELTSRDKALGWQGITGKMSYTTGSPDGVDNTNASNQYDAVAPYRTVSDYSYWANKMLESNGASSASIDVSLFADFIIVSKDEKGNPHVLSSPDEINSAGTKALVSERLGSDHESAQTFEGQTTWGKTTATPYYIPLSVIFDTYELKDSKTANISSLMSAIANDGGAKLKNCITKGNNLLENTHYDQVNGTGSGTGSSDAFNPYPYSMVFSMNTDNGKVVSSIYENSEAYVYFSPASVYTQYIALRTEYERISKSASGDFEQAKKSGSAQDPATVFQLGYYLAEMSILESYLNEALPQDMTRGYVGPSEATDLLGSGTAIPGNGDSTIKNPAGPEDLQKVSYVSLMYDFSHNMYGGTWNTAAAKWRQTEVDAIMDTLSTFGYGVKSDDGTPVGGTGVMKGITASQNIGRKTLFGIYQRASDFDENANPKEYVGDGGVRSGMYTPTYYPIQQHKMPDSEKVYRFQIVNAVPYETLLEYIKTQGFSDKVTFSYSASGDGLEGFNSITVTKAREKVAALAAQYEHEEEEAAKEENAEKVKLSTVNGSDRASKLQVLGGTSDTEVGKRIDAALLGYTASNMNSDNVHDLFDVVRATKVLKLETWIRYYNPIKSDGGDNDLFVTRVSPALTTYFPAILVNGYTPAGGHGESAGCEVSSALSPYSIAFDYFSIPSFAPCFASHTADTSYYGILNYELRPFYSASFVKTLSESANVPAVEAYEQAKEAKEEMEQEQADEAAVTNKNLACIYVLGKRVAYARTVQALMDEGVSISKQELINILNRMCNAGSSLSGATASGAAHAMANAVNDAVAKAGIEVEPITEQSSTPQFVSNPVFPLKSLNSVDLAELYELVQRKDFPETIKLMYMEERGKGQRDAGYVRLHKDNEMKIDAESWAGREGFASRSGCEGTAGNNNSSEVKEDFSEQSFGSILRDHQFTPWTENTESSNLMVADSPAYGGEEHMYIPASLFFTAVYDQKFNALLGEGGTYYWEDWEKIFDMMKNEGLEPEASDEISYNSAEKGKYNTRFATDWTDKAAQLVGLDIKDCDSASELIEICLAQMDKASDEIATGMINLIKDYNLLTQSMPSKMQNCLAWADYQNATDSEAQYQVDPSNANVVINVGNGGNGNSAPAVEHIRSKEEAEKLALKVSPAEDGDGFTVKNQDATDENGMELEGRLERGVEGSTWTSTVHPALYTMSATIARVNSMSSVTGTTYPYSGLANGRLQSGTDKYAVMQAHVIDYTSIASGIAGDLSTRTRAQVVSLVEPQFASISDFTDILGILGAMLGELGASMIQESAKIFTSVMFPDNDSGVATSEQASANASSSTMAYVMSDGTTMNRTPAALAAFNPNTGKLEYGYVANNTSSNYMLNGNATASAAGGNSGMVNTANVVLTTLSLPYKIIQTFALTLVLIFIGFIAFKNFYAYTSGNHGAKMILAQTQLKTVIWRSVMAVVMIGLPPLAGGTGFEGGNFILLEVISNISAFISSIFLGSNGSGIISFFTNIDMVESFGNNIAIWLLYFLCCAIISLCFIVGTFLVFILKIVMLVFFLFGPIVWALFVWPYQSKSDGKVTQYLNLGFLSSGAVGNLAPKGHVHQFVVFSAILIAWNLLFWFVAQIFVLGAGVEYADSASSNAAALVAQSMGYSTASMAMSNAAGFTDVLFGVAGDVGYGVRLLLTTLVCVLVFVLMSYLLIKALFRQVKATQGLGHDIKEGIKNGFAKADEAWHGNEETGKGGIKNGLEAAAQAAKVLKKGTSFDKDEKKRFKDLKKAQRKLKHATPGKGELPDDMQKFLRDEGYTADQIKALAQDSEARKKVAAELGDKRKDEKKEARDNQIWGALATGKDGKKSVGNLLKNSAKTARTLAGAARRGDGMHGVWEGLAQTAKTLNEAALDKESDAIAAENKVLETAKEAADKLLADGGKIDEAYLKGLDPAAFDELCRQGLASVDENGNRALAKDAGFKAQQASKELADKLDKNRNRILAKEKQKDDVADRLAKLGLSKDATLQEGLKVLKDGFDTQKASQIADAMGFKDDADGTRMEKAKKYMTDENFRREEDDKKSALDTAARQLGVDLTTTEGMKAAQAMVDSHSAMKELCGIEKEEDPNKKLARINESVNKIAGNFDGNMPSEDRAEAIHLATGVYPPGIEERQGLVERVMNGTANAVDYQKYTAMQLADKMAGREMALPDPKAGMKAATEALDNFTAPDDAVAFAKEHVVKTTKNGGTVVNMPMEMAGVASNAGLAAGVEAALTDAALSKYGSDTAAKIRQAASQVIDPNKTVEENMQALQNFGATSKQFEEVVMDTYEGRKAVSHFAKLEEADAEIARFEKQAAEAHKQAKQVRAQLAADEANPEKVVTDEDRAKAIQLAKDWEVIAMGEQDNINVARDNRAKIAAEAPEFCTEFKSLEEYKAGHTQAIATAVIGGAALGAVNGYKEAAAIETTVTQEIYSSAAAGAQYATHLMEQVKDPATRTYLEQSIQEGMTMNDIMNMPLDGMPPAAQDMLKMQIANTADDWAHSAGLNADPMIKVKLGDEQCAAYMKNIASDPTALQHVAEYTGADDIMMRQNHQDMYDPFVKFTDANGQYGDLSFNEEFVKCASTISSKGYGRDAMAATYIMASAGTRDKDICQATSALFDAMDTKQAQMFLQGDTGEVFDDAMSFLDSDTRAMVEQHKQEICKIIDTKKEVGDFEAMHADFKDNMHMVDGAIAYNATLVNSGLGDSCSLSEKRERARVNRIMSETGARMEVQGNQYSNPESVSQTLKERAEAAQKRAESVETATQQREAARAAAARKKQSGASASSMPSSAVGSSIPHVGGGN